MKHKLAYYSTKNRKHFHFIININFDERIRLLTNYIMLRFCVNFLHNIYVPNTYSFCVKVTQ